MLFLLFVLYCCRINNNSLEHERSPVNTVAESTWSSRLRHHPVSDSGVTAWPQDISALKHTSPSSGAVEKQKTGPWTQHHSCRRQQQNWNQMSAIPLVDLTEIINAYITMMAPFIGLYVDETSRAYVKDPDHRACWRTWASCLLGRIFSLLGPV